MPEQEDSQGKKERRRYARRAPLTPWVWTPAREAAVQMHWEGRLTGAQRAEALGVSRRTLVYWASCPEFQARRQAIMEAAMEESRRQWQARMEAEVKERMARLYAGWAKRSHKKK